MLQKLKSHRRRRPASILRNLLASEAGGGVVLLTFALAALVAANSPLQTTYFAALKTDLAGLSALHWINDGLMAVFFLMIGLEIKRELVHGQLSTWSRRLLPGVAAAGGMAVPAFVYISLNLGADGSPRGWAIPAATDIAFALGVLAILGARVPVSLKLFLTAVTVLDDLGAIVIIAAFYAAELSPHWLAAAAMTLLVLHILNRWRVERLWAYGLVGAALWFFVVKSGVHATLAGVALALFIPSQVSGGHVAHSRTALVRLEHALQPWVAYGIVPLFGFANAGVSLLEIRLSDFGHPVTAGVAAGLFFGKQLGVFAGAWVAVRLNWARRPAGASWGHLYGVSLICGIGFTMSLFIGLLAFPASPELQHAVKLGVLSGSLLSGIVGAVVLASCTVPAARHNRSRSEA